MKYLEMPLGTSFKTVSIWNPILEKNGEEIIGMEASLFNKGWLTHFIEEYSF